MDTNALRSLATLIRSNRLAALGTLRDGSPFVSMVVYAVSADLTSFYLHLSRLAIHTRDFIADPRLSLLIHESDRGESDPQTLTRLTIQGDAVTVSKTDSDYEAIKSLYLKKFPDAEMRFSLGDFNLYAIKPKSARYVGGFAQAFNLTIENFREAGKIS
ncbi:MAG: pyridoxamine 5'-phosphate oxidase family protein [Chloroflexi bacterium]|nr:pyridoxamine 5'-phosphate oxidase family protein [Chloroflexota bacterium]